MITIEQAQDFDKQFFDGKFPYQRYGQAFCNFFNITCPELFYEENQKTAIFHAWLVFVDCTPLLEE